MGSIGKKSGFSLNVLLIYTMNHYKDQNQKWVISNLIQTKEPVSEIIKKMLSFWPIYSIDWQHYIYYRQFLFSTLFISTLQLSQIRRKFPKALRKREEAGNEIPPWIRIRNIKNRIRISLVHWVVFVAVYFVYLMDYYYRIKRWVQPIRRLQVQYLGLMQRSSGIAETKNLKKVKYFSDETWFKISKNNHLWL